MDLQTTFTLWQRSLQTNRRSNATQKQYSYHTGQLVNWLATRAVTHPHQIDWPHIEEYLAGQHTGHSQNTVRQAVFALRSFFDYCRLRELIPHQQYNQIKHTLDAPPAQYNAQRTLTVAEIERLIDDCDDTPKGKRDAALMSLLFDSGLRSAELCRVRADRLEYDVELSPGVVVNRLTVQIKGGETLPGYFGIVTRDRLDSWLQVRANIAKPNEAALFVGVGGKTPGRTITPGGLRALLRKIGAAAGVKGVSPHAFRRAFAVALEMNGASTRTIKELGRWKTLQMVLLYTRDYQAAVKYSQFCPMDRAKR